MPPPASTLTRLENGTLEIRLTLPWPEIQSALEKEVLAAIKTARLPGFRPGSAPRHLVEPRLDRARLLSQAVQKLLPQIYSRAVTDHHLKSELTRQSRTDLETEFILSHIQTRAKLQDRKATLDFLQNLL